MRTPRVYAHDATTTVNAQHWDGIFLPAPGAEEQRAKLVWWRNGERGELSLADRCGCHPQRRGGRCPAGAMEDSAARYLRDVVDA